MKRVGEVLPLAIQYLQDRKISFPRRVSESLLAAVLGLKRMDLYLQWDYPMQEQELAQFRLYLQKAGRDEPVEYILGEVLFLDLALHVSPAVLIPRQETELLVEEACKRMAGYVREGGVAWDICCGSGCIGLSIKKRFPELHMVLADISPESVQVAACNALENRLSVECVCGDFLQPFKEKKASFIFCNPPYISQDEYDLLDYSVRGYEPALALVAGEQGLRFYEKLAQEAPEHLLPNGKMFLEIGAGQGEALFRIFSSACWKKKELLADYAGHDRFFFLEIE